MADDEFMRDKALGWGLAAAAVALVLLAPVFCTATSGGRVVICGGLIPIATNWLIASVVALAVGVFTASVYLYVRKTRNSDGS